jgi:hypothetical protein
VAVRFILFVTSVTHAAAESVLLALARNVSEKAELVPRSDSDDDVLPSVLVEIGDLERTRLPLRFDQIDNLDCVLERSIVLAQQYPYAARARSASTRAPSIHRRRRLPAR